MRELIGERFGRLTVVSQGNAITGGNGKEYRSWRCICDCGTEREVKEPLLLYGKTKSCGCLYSETRSSSKNKSHGLSRTRIYAEWGRMIQRCSNPRVDSYKRYGGRGIRVCNSWRESFESFYEWAIQNGYSDNLTIDRIDVNGGYCPGNCRWVSNKVQANNKTTNQFFMINGVSKTLTEWCEMYGASYQTVWARINRRGMSIIDALETKVDNKKSHKKEKRI